MRIRAIVAAVFVFTGVTFGEGVLAAVVGERLFMEKRCIACHGLDAKSPIQSDYPIVAGLEQEHALVRMKRLRSGPLARLSPNGIKCRGALVNLSAEDMAFIASWLADLKR